MQEKEDETVRFGLWIRIPDIPLTTDVMSIGTFLSLISKIKSFKNDSSSGEIRLFGRLNMKK